MHVQSHKILYFWVLVHIDMPLIQTLRSMGILGSTWRHTFSVWIGGFIRKPNYPWPDDYPLANHTASYESSANHEMSPFPGLLLLSGIFGSFPPRGLKYSLLWPSGLFHREYSKIFPSSPPSSRTQTPGTLLHEQRWTTQVWTVRSN